MAGGEITKAARNWLGNPLDASKRSQILLMDCEDILNLYVKTNLPLPKGALSATSPSRGWDEVPPFYVMSRQSRPGKAHTAARRRMPLGAGR